MAVSRPAPRRLLYSQPHWHSSTASEPGESVSAAAWICTSFSVSVCHRTLRPIYTKPVVVSGIALEHGRKTLVKKVLDRGNVALIYHLSVLELDTSFSTVTACRCLLRFGRNPSGDMQLCPEWYS